MYETLYEFTETECYLKSIGAGIIVKNPAFLSSGLNSASAFNKALDIPCLIAHAVSGMLPKNKLRARMMTRLRVFAGAEHTHAAQKPEVISF